MFWNWTESNPVVRYRRHFVCPYMTKHHNFLCLRLYTQNNIEYVNIRLCNVLVFAFVFLAFIIAFSNNRTFLYKWTYKTQLYR